MPGELQFLKGQLLESVPVPEADLSGQTIIITGANTGLGFEAVKHLYRMKCSTIILACRNEEKGATAREKILDHYNFSPPPAGSHEPDVQVWKLDMAEYASVKAFGERAAQLPRLDAAILNAGVSLTEFALAEGMEETITVNVTATFLLAMLLLPTLQKSAERYPNAKPPHLAIVGSVVHFFANTKSLVGHQNGQILKELSDSKTAQMGERYFLSKLMVMLLVRQLARRISAAAEQSGNTKAFVVVNNVAPGYCRTSLFRHEETAASRFALRLIGRDSEKGGRTLILGILAGKDSHGQYMSEGVVKNCSAWVQSDEGEKIGEKLWTEVIDIAENIVPGIKAIV